jgi:serine/threonine protein kinase
LVNATIRLKGYDRVEQIAQGRHAVVFKAHDSAHQRTVVFKVLLPHLVEDPRFLTRFKRSVQIATQIEHENLVNVLLYGRADVSYFVAFEHYNGVTLEKVLSEDRRIPTDIALHVVLDVATGLEACHQKNLVHRDVQPDNIILTRSGRVKLDNLSLATDVSEAGRLAFAGYVASSVAYMSPEQTLGENLTAQTDVFSLGVVAWEILCGESAFGQGTPAAVADRIKTTSLKRVSEVTPMVEPAISDIVQRMLEKDRSRRYHTAAEVAADLREAMRNSGYLPDTKAMARFVESPAAYTESYRQNTIKALKEKVEAAGEANPAMLVGCYEKLSYLEPDNEQYHREIERLRVMVQRAQKNAATPALSGEDPRMTYRVILESFDTARESEASFALKLAMKLRVPLTAVKPFVAHLPAALPGAHIHRKAVFVAKMMEELGAVTRIEACRPEPQKRICPECRSEADADAACCPCCQHRFIAVVELRPGLDDDAEPYTEDVGHNGPSSFVRRFLEPLTKAKK